MNDQLTYLIAQQRGAELQHAGGRVRLASEVRAARRTSAFGVEPAIGSER
jgi:hypothetical protein